MARDITKEEFEAWRSNPVTVGVMNELRLTRDEVLKRLGQGNTVYQENADATQAMTARAIGKIEGINELLNIRFSDAE
jgi:hypothetical protein